MRLQLFYYYILIKFFNFNIFFYYLRFVIVRCVIVEYTFVVVRFNRLSRTKFNRRPNTTVLKNRNNRYISAVTNKYAGSFSKVTPGRWSRDNRSLGPAKYTATTIIIKFDKHAHRNDNNRRSRLEGKPCADVRCKALNGFSTPLWLAPAVGPRSCSCPCWPATPVTQHTKYVKNVSLFT